MRSASDALLEQSALRGQSALVMPTLDSATEVPWSRAIARHRGIFGFDSLDPRSRSFNLIRARLLELRKERGWHLFGVLSATANVGKSFITANVAAALSRNPTYQTYAIDLDLRRGSLTMQFAIQPTDSISDFLDPASPLAAPRSYKLEGERLVVLPTKPGAVHSAELLAGERAQAMLRASRTAGDKAIHLFDLPPVFANDDAAIAMSRLDAYILVAEEGKTKQHELSDVTALLGEDRMAGVILNKYRGGLISEGYGVDDYFGGGYSAEDDRP